MYRFLLVTFGVSWLFQAAFGLTKSPFWLATAMWTPALGALAEGHRVMPKWWPGPKTTPPRTRFLKLFIGSTWPVLLWLALTVLATLPFQLPSPTLAPFRHPLYPAKVAAALWMALAPLLPLWVALLGAFGEEYGWRGYLTPKLAGRLGWFWASVLVGIIWAVWHTPSILFGYEYGWYMRPEGVLLFVPVTCGVAVIHTAVYLRWGVWGAALTHGAVNSWAVIYYVLYPQLLLDRWLWGPVGLQGAATAWLVAALTWIYTKRQVRSLPKAEDARGGLHVAVLLHVVLHSLLEAVGVATYLDVRLRPRRSRKKTLGDWKKEGSSEASWQSPSVSRAVLHLFGKVVRYGFSDGFVPLCQSQEVGRGYIHHVFGARPHDVWTKPNQLKFLSYGERLFDIADVAFGQERAVGKMQIHHDARRNYGASPRLLSL